MPNIQARQHPSRTMIAIAFAAVYVVWGSTYLAIRFAVQTIPPFLMAGVRFVIAGALLYTWVRLRGAPRPTRSQWRATAIVGALLLLGGNGGVVWAEQHVPSGITALLVATVPLWMVLFEWFRPGGSRPRLAVIGGVVLGLAGMALLVQPGSPAGGGAADPVGAAVLIAASVSWAWGSLWSRQADLPAVPLLATAMEMMAGGVLLLATGALTGELGRLAPRAISLPSAASLGYLVIFGSLVGFTAYTWLLRVASPAAVSTYAYVNPVVAVVLGWAIASEPITPRTLSAAAVIIGAVALITAGRARPASTPRLPQDAAPSGGRTDGRRSAAPELQRPAPHPDAPTGTTVSPPAPARERRTPPSRAS